MSRLLNVTQTKLSQSLKKKRVKSLKAQSLKEVVKESTPLITTNAPKYSNSNLKKEKIILEKKHDNDSSYHMSTSPHSITDSMDSMMIEASRIPAWFTSELNLVDVDTTEQTFIIDGYLSMFWQNKTQALQTNRLILDYLHPKKKSLRDVDLNSMDKITDFDFNKLIIAKLSEIISLQKYDIISGLSESKFDRKPGSKVLESVSVVNPGMYHPYSEKWELLSYNDYVPFDKNYLFRNIQYDYEIDTAFPKYFYWTKISFKSKKNTKKEKLIENGLFQMRIKFQITLQTSFHLFNFPFDYQLLMIKLYFNITKYQIILKKEDLPFPLPSIDDFQNPCNIDMLEGLQSEWHMFSPWIDFRRYKSEYLTDPYIPNSLNRHAIIFLRLQRKPAYFVVEYIFVEWIIVLSSITGFLSENIGDKLNVSIFVLLTICIVQYQLEASVSSRDELLLIDLWSIFGYFLVFTCFVQFGTEFVDNKTFVEGYILVWSCSLLPFFYLYIKSKCINEENWSKLAIAKVKRDLEYTTKAEVEDILKCKPTESDYQEL